MSKEKALGEAIAAIYFEHSSGYLHALWTIVEELDPEAAKLLHEDEQSAYERYVENR